MSIANALIERMRSVNAEVIEVAEGCLPEQWKLPLAEEDGRPVGVVFHHIATVYPMSIDWAQKIGNGEALPNVNREWLNKFNARHAREQKDTPQSETIALLQEVTEESAVALEELTDEQLKRTSPNPLVGGQEFSGEWVMQAFAIGHAESHLKAIKATIGPA